MRTRFALPGCILVLAACTGDDPSVVAGGSDAGGTSGDGGLTADGGTPDGPPPVGVNGTHVLDITPKTAVVLLDTAKAPAAPATQPYLAKLDGADVTATTAFTVADPGYGSFSGVSFVSALTLPGLAVAGTTRVDATNAAAKATTRLSVIALKTSGADPDPYVILPYLGTPTSKTAIVKLAPNLGAPANVADIHLTLTSDPSNASDASLLVTSIAAMSAGEVAHGCPAQTAKDTNADGVLDIFTAVVSATPLCFLVTFKDNNLVAATSSIRVLQLIATAVAQPAAASVQSRKAYVFVPPTP